MKKPDPDALKFATVGEHGHNVRLRPAFHTGGQILLTAKDAGGDFIPINNPPVVVGPDRALIAGLVFVTIGTGRACGKSDILVIADIRRMLLKITESLSDTSGLDQ